MRDDAWKAQANAAMESYARGAGPDAFLAVFRPLQPRIRAFLERRCEPELAKELTQDTFVAIHKHRGSFQCGTDVMTWAFTIARRLLIDEARRNKHRKAYRQALTDAAMLLQKARPFGPDPGAPERPDVVAARLQLGRRIVEVLTTLPDEQRETFELVYLDGLPIPRAAQVLDVRPENVSLRVHRACKALREQLGDEVREWLEDRQ